MQIKLAGIGRSLPTSSTADRKVATKSKGHASGHLIFKRGDAERVLMIESDLEMKWAIILDADPCVRDLREQVVFPWSDSGRMRRHYFDFVALLEDGTKVAFVVKPARRARKHTFRTETRSIAEQATGAGFVDEVRVLTDRHLDQTRLSNARLFRSVRDVDPEADIKAQTIAHNLVNPSLMSALVDQIGLGSRGFRAFVRLIQSGLLRQLRHEVISLETLICGGHEA